MATTPVKAVVPKAPATGTAPPYTSHTATPGATGSTGSAPSALNQTQQSIFDLMSQTLSSWGLSTLLPDLRKFIIGGDTSPDTLALALSQTDAYKQRFSANAARVAAGLSELTPAQYISLEEQYRQVMQSYGLPSGFYDQQSDLDAFIAKDISPMELQTRAQVAHDTYTNAPDYMKDLWSQYFGTKGDAIAAILDPDVATSVIQDRGREVQIGGAAAQFGMGINESRAKQFDQAGVTLDGARKAYQRIASTLPTDRNIGERFGTQFGQQQEEDDLLLGDAHAGDLRQQLYGEEQSLFKGSSGMNQSALGVSQDR